MRDQGKIKLFHNLDIRIVSLILAVTLWLYASTERYYRLSFRCPVVVRNIPEGYSLASCPSPVFCEIEARGKDLIAFQLKRPKILADAENHQIKTMRVKLSQDNLALPFNLKARSVRFSDGEIEVNMDRLAEKEVGITLDIVGDPADGFVLSESVPYQPGKVVLRGPAKQLDMIGSIYTAPIKVDGLSEGATVRSVLVLPDSCLFTVRPETIEVHLQFEKSGERVFKNVPLSVINRSRNYLVSFAPGTIDLVLSGPKNVLDAASASDLKISLDLNGLRPGKHQLQASIELPEKLVLIAASPRDFEVTIK